MGKKEMDREGKGREIGGRENRVESEGREAINTHIDNLATLLFCDCTYEYVVFYT